MVRMDKNRWAKILMEWVIIGGRNRGKQKKRWKDEIDTMLGRKCYHQIAQCRKEWERLREAFAQQGAT